MLNLYASTWQWCYVFRSHVSIIELSTEKTHHFFLHSILWKYLSCVPTHSHLKIGLIINFEITYVVALKLVESFL